MGAAWIELKEYKIAHIENSEEAITQILEAAGTSMLVMTMGKSGKIFKIFGSQISRIWWSGGWVRQGCQLWLISFFLPWIKRKTLEPVVVAYFYTQQFFFMLLIPELCAMLSTILYPVLLYFISFFKNEVLVLLNLFMTHKEIFAHNLKSLFELFLSTTMTSVLSLR